jgi:hypothetical protein
MTLKLQHSSEHYFPNMLSVVLLTVIILSVIVLSVIVLNV